MTNPNEDFKKVFSTELDETLFESIEFSSKLKDEVRRKISSEAVKPKNIFQKQFYKIGLIAAILLFSFISLGLFQKTYKQSPNIDRNIELNTFQIEPKNSNLISGRSSNNVVELGDIMEAKTLFGEDLLLPSYSPKSFKLDRVHALSDGNNDIRKVIFTYSSNQQIYSVIVEREEEHFKPLNFERIDVNGAEGFLKKIESDAALDAELHWYIDDIHYMVSGLISSEEAIKIAQSFK